jgi:hypothetical protein
MKTAPITGITGQDGAYEKDVGEFFNIGTGTDMRIYDRQTLLS